MSSFMLDDKNTINDINPYVTRDFSLPGSLRKSSDFADFVDEYGRQEKDSFGGNTSPICDYGIAAGDRTGDLCMGGCKGVPKDKILHPKRNIDKGETALPKKLKVSQMYENAVIYKYTNMYVVVLGLILALILLTLTR